MKFEARGPEVELVCLLTRRGRRRRQLPAVARALAVRDLFAPRPEPRPDPRQTVLAGELDDAADCAIFE